MSRSSLSLVSTTMGLEGGLLCRKDKPPWVHRISASKVGGQEDEL